MKNLSRFISVVMLTLIASTAYGQQPPAGMPQDRQQMARPSVEETAKIQVDWMKEELQLNEATVKKVSEIVTKYTQAREDEIRKVMSSGGNFESIATITDEQYAKMDAELKPVLGDATYEKYAKIVAEKRASGGPMGPRPDGNQPGRNQQGPPQMN